MSNSLILNFQSPINSITLTFEDNGEVAYAYLKKDNIIIGDVWLYNYKSIKHSEWNDINNAPFLNPAEYISEEGIMKKTVTIHDVLVTWEEDGTELDAYVYIHEDLYGVVGPGDKPGYARYAIKNNPIARVMNID